MAEACALVTAAGNSLLDATTKLIEQPFSREVRYALVDSARNILETTMKVKNLTPLIFPFLLLPPS